jgi:hypothetical protein
MRRTSIVFGLGFLDLGFAGLGASSKGGGVADGRTGCGARRSTDLGDTSVRLRGTPGSYSTQESSTSAPSRAQSPPDALQGPLHHGAPRVAVARRRVRARGVAGDAADGGTSASAGELGRRMGGCAGRPPVLLGRDRTAVLRLLRARPARLATGWRSAAALGGRRRPAAPLRPPDGSPAGRPALVAGARRDLRGQRLVGRGAQRGIGRRDAKGSQA